MAEFTEDELRLNYSAIPWGEPLEVVVNGYRAYACRYCIALHGLKGIDVLNGDAAYGTRQECLDHVFGTHD